MIVAAWVFSVTVLVVVGLLRAAGASLVRTPRADAVRDAANGGNASAAAIVSELLDERPRLQPALGATLTVSWWSLRYRLPGP